MAPRLQDVHEPAHHDPGRPRPGGAAPDRRGRARRRRRTRASRRWPRGIRERAARAASTARTAASCRRWWPALLRERGLHAGPRRVVHGRAARRAPHRGAPGSSAFLDRGLRAPTATASKVEHARRRPRAHRAHGRGVGGGRAARWRRARARARGRRRRRGHHRHRRPGGGTPEKPVGLVFIALDGAAGDARAPRASSRATASASAHQAVQAALEMIRRGAARPLGRFDRGRAARSAERHPRLRGPRAARTSCATALAAAIERLRPTLPGVRWVRRRRASTSRCASWAGPRADALDGSGAAAARRRRAAARPCDARCRGLGPVPRARAPARALARARPAGPGVRALQAACEAAAVAARASTPERARLPSAPDARPLARPRARGRRCPTLDLGIGAPRAARPLPQRPPARRARSTRRSPSFRSAARRRRCG